MKTTKPIAFSLFVLLATQIASAYYCPSTGRWLSRDPMGEPGFENLRAAGMLPKVGQAISPASLPPGRWINRDPIAAKKEPNRYTFVANNPVGTVDLFGLATVSAGKCEVIVAYGHGTDGSPHHFDFAGPCSAGWFLGCYSSQTDGGLGRNGIPGAVSISGEYDFATDPGRFDRDFNTSWAAAKAKAGNMCILCKCVCHSITVKAVFVPSNDSLNDLKVPGEKYSHPDVTVPCSSMNEKF